MMKLVEKELIVTVNGRDMVFSEKELVDILEKNIKHCNACQIEISDKPVEEKGFKVNPFEINQKLFKKQRKDKYQERTRQIILEAFEELKEKPEKYADPFITFRPEKNWIGTKSIQELIDLAESIGDHLMDWVEQALEWAQRIQNGESWETVCNEPDTAKYHRLILWKNGRIRFLGGCTKINSCASATNVYCIDFYLESAVGNTVPAVIMY